MREYNFQVGDTGRLTDASRQIMANVIATFAGKWIKIRVWEEQESASDKQRKYYFAVIVSKFIQHFAEKNRHFSKDDMHASLMCTIGGFNKPFVNALTGEEQEDRLSWNDLSKKQAEGYFTLCRKDAAERGFNCPEPNEPEAIWLMDNYR